jgi:hypothetical protein
MEHDTSCPYCGEATSVWVDLGAGSEQRYVEDCAVCCRPCEVIVSDDGSGMPAVQLRRQDT